MKNKISLIRAATVALFAGSAFVAAQAADIPSSMTIDAQAPLRATLLPTVSVDADATTSESNPATMRIADTEPLQVTLLPTVYVSARAKKPELATTLLPTVRVTARVESVRSKIVSPRIVEADDVMLGLPLIDDALPSTAEQPLALRSHTMPR